MMEIYIRVKVKTFNIWLYLNDVEHSEGVRHWARNCYDQPWGYSYGDILRIYRGLE